MSESPQDRTIGNEGDKVEEVTTRKVQADDASEENAGEEASEGGDDLFGAGDEDDDDEDNMVVSKPARQKRQIDSASPSSSPTDQAAKSRARLPSSPSSKAHSPTPSSRSNQSYTALEHRETSAEPPMGIRNAEGAQAELQEASFTLPSLPFRRGLPHYFARLPNLLQYRSEVFDEDSFDEVKEDEMLQSKDGIRIDDEGLRSLLTTSNTIRWRWTDKHDEDGVRIPESNARIVKWSDGSSSLQLGSEFYDISQTTERANTSSSDPAVPPPPATATKELSQQLLQQPVQHLTHLFVKHDGQEQINVYQAETPIMGNFTFRPSSTASESHQRLAKAVRKQKGTLVKETIVREDPELEKERLEREEKKRGQKRMREIKRKNKGKEDEDDDAFWDSAARSARRTGARSMASDGVLDSDAVNGIDQGLDDVLDDDGFVVDDEGGEDDDGEGSQEDMDVDEEPDEMELMEAEMEKQEALRKAGKASKTEAGADVPQSEAPTEVKPEDEDGATTSRKRRVIDSDDE